MRHAATLGRCLRREGLISAAEAQQQGAMVAVCSTVLQACLRAPDPAQVLAELAPAATEMLRCGSGWT